MRIPLFAIILVFVIWLNVKATQSRRRDEDIKRAFWDRENEANSTRKQPLDNLAYITIPADLLAPALTTPSFAASDAASRIERLREENVKIVNLTGYSNTDLKLQYGPANLSALSEYDAHYTVLATSLQECAQALFDEERFDEARRVLEFAASTGTDISACYRLLVDLYRHHASLSGAQATEKIQALLEGAKELRALSRDGIVRMLEEDINAAQSADVSSP